jgi:hypothetical protein
MGNQTGTHNADFALIFHDLYLHYYADYASAYRLAHQDVYLDRHTSCELKKHAVVADQRLSFSPALLIPINRTLYNLYSLFFLMTITPPF